MIRIDAIWLTTEPMGMRAGTETALDESHHSPRPVASGDIERGVQAWIRSGKSMCHGRASDLATKLSDLHVYMKGRCFSGALTLRTLRTLALHVSVRHRTNTSTSNYTPIYTHFEVCSSDAYGAATSPLRSIDGT